jgi:hypothetical protein
MVLIASGGNRLDEMERKRSANRRSPWTALLAAALAICPAFGSSCGAGIYDGLGGAQVTKTITSDGGVLVLGQARLVMGPGTFAAPTEVTLRRIPAIAHAGAYGPVFQVDVPSSNVFRQDATFELQVPSIGANQPSLALGALDPTLSLDVQQWVPVFGSGLDASQSLLTGSIPGLSTMTTIQLGAVVSCPPTTACPAGQACNSGACQVCPTGSPCPS